MTRPGLRLAGLLLTACAANPPPVDYAAVVPTRSHDQAALALAPTPPMGWNSWNKFGCHVSDMLVRETADALVASGMRDAGYTYVNIDDCWALSERVDGHMKADPSTFPEGIKATADYVHARGLKLGIYSDRGTATCEKRAASHGYEAVDAADFEAWGVDFLKYDNCNEVAGSTDASQEADYRVMHEALLARRRPIVFSICAWKFKSWMPLTGNLWRTARDIRDTWHSIVVTIDVNGRYAAAAGPGHWNDPDMLEVGNGGMTDDEYRSHFSMWALMAAPLIAGNDVRDMSDATKLILLNREVIAVDQDRLGRQGTRVGDIGSGLEIYSRELGDGGARAVVLFNRTTKPTTMTVTWTQLGVAPGAATVRDLWQHRDLGEQRDSFAAMVAPHGVVMLRVVPSGG